MKNIRYLLAGFCAPFALAAMMILGRHSVDGHSPTSALSDALGASLTFGVGGALVASVFIWIANRRKAEITTW